MKHRRGQITLAVVFLVLIAAFFYFDLGRFFTIEFLRQEHDTAAAAFADHPVLFFTGFLAAFTAYVVVGLMGTWIVMIAAGSIFGVWLAAIGVGLAYAIGGTIQFLVARYLFRDYVEKRWGAQLAKLDAEIEKDGNLVLFSMRLMSIIPYPTINLLMALTTIRTMPFFIVTLIADSIVGAVYANAGTTIMEIESIGDVLSVSLVVSLALLGLFPLAVKLILNRIRANRAGP